MTVADCPDCGSQGKVPKNNFGNIDLFVPSMLPAGAVHLRSKFSRWLCCPIPRLILRCETGKYAAKCAKELGIDFGEAIVRSFLSLAYDRLLMYLDIDRWASNSDSAAHCLSSPASSSRRSTLILSKR